MGRILVIARLVTAGGVELRPATAAEAVVRWFSCRLAVAPRR
jgi:hypothetical protein